MIDNSKLCGSENPHCEGCGKETHHKLTRYSTCIKTVIQWSLFTFIRWPGGLNFSRNTRHRVGVLFVEIWNNHLLCCSNPTFSRFFSRLFVGNPQNPHDFFCILQLQSWCWVYTGADLAVDIWYAVIWLRNCHAAPVDQDKTDCRGGGRVRKLLIGVHRMDLKISWMPD